jgi:hypothetical protein
MGHDEDLFEAARTGDLAAARAALDGGGIACCYHFDKVRQRVRRSAHDAAPSALCPRRCVLCRVGARYGGSPHRRCCCAAAASRLGCVLAALRLLCACGRAQYGRMPSHWAAEKGHLEVVRLLLDRGAQCESSDTCEYKTPLHWAAEEGHLEVVQLLLERGADKETTSKVRAPRATAAADCVGAWLARRRRFAKLACVQPCRTPRRPAPRACSGTSLRASGAWRSVGRTHPRAPRCGMRRRPRRKSPRFG